MHTEDEARTKWCPFARPSQPLPQDCGSIRGNRNMSDEVDEFGPLVRCVGSACMAWRWKTIIEEEGSNMNMWPHKPPVYGKSDTEGYCGLAGTS